MDFVLQNIYKIPSQPHISSHSSWSFCLDVYTTADKYLEPELSAEAYRRFVSIARSERSIMQIFNIIETLRRDVDHNEDFVKLAGELQVTHLLELLKYGPFRAYMDNKKESMWEVIDTFATKERETAENTQDKSFILCTDHTSLIFHGPGKQENKRCTICFMKGGSISEPPSRMARVPKY